MALDEADDLLDRNFEPQVRWIMEQIGPDWQMFLFSTAWQDGMKEFAAKTCERKNNYHEQLDWPLDSSGNEADPETVVTICTTHNLAMKPW